MPPDAAPLSTAWILRHRPPRNSVDARRPYAWLLERERTAAGTVEDTATIFITNRECPYRCLMCDLWKNTTEARVPAGAVAGQIEWALRKMPGARHAKLYNSGNFFDVQAVPREDLPRIADLVRDLRTVIVESHPRLVARSAVAFADMIAPALQVAMGLETVHPRVLPRLNKQMTLTDFERAVRFLGDHGIDTRAFILLRPPFLGEADGVEWAIRSVDFAFSIGVECAAVIPTRPGNGALDALQRQGQFAPPTLRSMEEVLDYGVALGRGRVFMDLWDAERFATCTRCRSARLERLRRINLSQQVSPRVACGCEGAA